MPSHPRNRYDSFLVWLYVNQKEAIIPDHIRNTIPHSTASTWRKTDISAFIGHELSGIQREAIEQYALLQQHQNLRKTVRVITRVWLTVSGVILPLLRKQRENAETLLNETQRLFTVFPRNLAFKLAGISPAYFYEQLARIRFRCGLSPASLCFKRHPLQLAVAEVLKIKKLFDNPDFICWPAVSLYYEGLRNHGLYISLSTFYKYVKILGLQRKWLKNPVKTIGLQALTANQYLHVDTTFWPMEQEQKAAIVFVCDNFSRKILSWHIAPKNSAENIKNALQKAILIIREYYPKHTCCSLVADGGSENNANSITALLNDCKKPEITKVIARKDICFSNSPVEAINKIVKRYLRHYKPLTFDALENCLEQIVHDYNHKRPHGSLAGLTPFEAYTQPLKSLSFRPEIAAAKTIRLAANRQVNCNICRP